MKISYLHIRNYKQFSDLKLDLTYPEGHGKAGQPLDKICIIGQSGTGKTNLLDIIKKSTVDFSEQPKNSYLPFSEFVGEDTDDRYITTKFKLFDEKFVETLFTLNKSTIHGKLLNPFMAGEKITARLPLYESLDFLDNEKNYFVSTVKEYKIKTKTVIEELSMTDDDKKRLKEIENKEADLLLDAHGDYSVYAEELQNFSYLKSRIEERYKKENNIPVILQNIKENNLINKFIVNINEENNSWKLLKESIDNFDIEKTKYTKQLSYKLLNDDDYSKKDFKKDMALWENKNENILKKIAEDINSIIKKFNLELQIDEDTQSYEELKIKDLSNNTIIEYDDLSTGTKNLLSTFIPLKSYKPKDSIILIDEPEMSFYPDIQRELTDLYLSVGTNNQLVMATHSPLIASSFEPWEVVELKFDDNNQIYRELYYPVDEENHINNYVVDPRMLTWTSILVDVFDLKEDSFPLREKKLMEYGMLKAEIKAMEKGKERDDKLREFKKLSSLLGLQN